MHVVLVCPAVGCLMHIVQVCPAAGGLMHVVQVSPDLACTAEAVAGPQLQTESLQHCVCIIM